MAQARRAGTGCSIERARRTNGGARRRILRQRSRHEGRDTERVAPGRRGRRNGRRRPFNRRRQWARAVAHAVGEEGPEITRRKRRRDRRCRKQQEDPRECRSDHESSGLRDARKQEQRQSCEHGRSRAPCDPIPKKSLKAEPDGSAPGHPKMRHKCRADVFLLTFESLRQMRERIRWTVPPDAIGRRCKVAVGVRHYCRTDTRSQHLWLTGAPPWPRLPEKRRGVGLA